MAAKQQARRDAKLAKKAANRAVNGDGETTSGATTPGGSQILRREWKTLSEGDADGRGTVRLLTWNMLAQTLVRESRVLAGEWGCVHAYCVAIGRELFPGSGTSSLPKRLSCLLSAVRRLPALGRT